MLRVINRCTDVDVFIFEDVMCPGSVDDLAKEYINSGEHETFRTWLIHRGHIIKFVKPIVKAPVYRG